MLFSEHVSSKGSLQLAERAAAPIAEPDVLKAEDVPALKWQAADEEGLVAFLVGEKNFNEDRVRKQIQKMASTKGKSAQGIQFTIVSMKCASLWCLQSLNI